MNRQAGRGKGGSGEGQRILKGEGTSGRMQIGKANRIQIPLNQGQQNTRQQVAKKDDLAGGKTPPIPEVNNNIKIEGDLISDANKPRSHTVRCWLSCKINGQSLTALCASGSTDTYMTHKFMEKLNLTHLLNRKITGYAEGPGLGKQIIIGQLAKIPVELSEEVTVVCSFFVINNDDYDVLYFGMDTCFKLDFLSPVTFHTRRLHFQRNEKAIEIPFLEYEDQVPPVALSCTIAGLITCKVDGLDEEYESYESSSSFPVAF